MHQRSGASRPHQLVSAASGGTAPGNGPPCKLALTRKLVLWLVLLLQICFIGCFWLLQLGFNARISSGSTSAASRSGEDSHDGGSVFYAGARVNFIKKAAANGLEATRTQKLLRQLRVFNASKFTKDFFLKTKRLNETGTLVVINDEMVMRENEAASQLWCFREGTLNESRTKADEQELADQLHLWTTDEQCQCEPNWHGKDCGQPELIWRALMTAKEGFKLLVPSKEAANHLVYMLEGNFFSLELLELQLKTVAEVVDYFLIYWTHSNANRKQLKQLESRLKSTLNHEKYLLFHCSDYVAIKRNYNCSAREAYRYFSKRLPLKVKPTDLLLYTSEREVPAPRALKFLKYYAADVQLLRFRMKYVVYGFFWQHPERTHLCGLISSFSQLANGDPKALLDSASRPDLVIGDLNHYGGWYCKYCQQPEEIIDELHAELSSLRHAQFPNATKDRHIDAEYLQQLIANGLYVDGKTELLKMRPYSERYYAPSYAADNNWKYGHLMANLFESLNEDADEAANY